MKTKWLSNPSVGTSVLSFRRDPGYVFPSSGSEYPIGRTPEDFYRKTYNREFMAPYSPDSRSYEERQAVIESTLHLTGTLGFGDKPVRICGYLAMPSCVPSGGYTHPVIGVCSDDNCLVFASPGPESYWFDRNFYQFEVEEFSVSIEEQLAYPVKLENGRYKCAVSLLEVSRNEQGSVVNCVKLGIREKPGVFIRGEIRDDNWRGPVMYSNQ